MSNSIVECRMLCVKGHESEVSYNIIVAIVHELQYAAVQRRALRPLTVYRMVLRLYTVVTRTRDPLKPNVHRRGTDQRWLGPCGILVAVRRVRVVDLMACTW